MNELIVDQFNKLIKQIRAEYLNALLDNNIKEADMHTYRLKQVKRILSIIISLGFEITNESDLKGIPGIGQGTLNRIKEILETGQLYELQDKYAKTKQSKINSIQELLGIIGVGEQLARKLVIEKGITSVDQLRAAVNKGTVKVNYQIKLGLKYYNRLQKKIPRHEIDEIKKYLVKKANQIDPDLYVLICGSYRRGVQIAGDIDVMIFHPDVKYVRDIYRSTQLNNKSDEYHPKPYLILFVDLLTRENFLLDKLSFNVMKYMGFCSTWKNFSQNNLLNNFPDNEPPKYEDNLVYRIDIRFMPSNSIPAAMLYFTGPQQLNEEMRKQAKKRNMLLNEYGLFIVDSRGNRILVPTHSEKDIFEEIGMRYLTPEERDSYRTIKFK